MKITEGFDNPPRGYYCPEHGFRKKIIGKGTGDSIIPFANLFNFSFTALCPICKRECKEKIYLNQINLLGVDEL